jgi:hypothetical protein
MQSGTDGRERLVDCLKGIYEAVRDGRIPGGCPDCNAYQTLRRVAPRIYSLTIHHDDTCPSFLAMTKEQQA